MNAAEKTRFRVMETAYGASGTAVALESASTVEINAGAGVAFQLTLDQDVTIANPVGSYEGRLLALRLTQDGTGSRTVTWGDSFLFASGTAPTLTSTAGASDLVTFVHQGDQWWCLGTQADIQ